MAVTNIAILLWAHEIEDFLDSIGLSMDQFCSKVTSGWMFGYVQALARAGVRTALICVSREKSVHHNNHKLTGTPIITIPSSWLYRVLRHPMQNPYAWSSDGAYGYWGKSSVRRWIQGTVLNALPYLATPVITLAKILRKEGYDALLCQEYEYARFDVCVALGRLLSLPVFATFQGGDFQASKWEKWFRPTAMRVTAGLVVGTKTELDRLKSTYFMPKRKLAHIPNPLDVGLWQGMHPHKARAMLGLPTSSEIVVWHGRIDIKNKGLDVLLDAWRRVVQSRTGRELHLIMVGSGKDNAILHNMIQGLDSDQVIFVNEFVTDQKLLKAYLSSADIYAFPSRHEGFPVAPLEAMAVGLPIVAADAQGIPDILLGGEKAGGIVVPRDDPHSFAGALGRLLDEPKLRSDLGARARNRVEFEFSLDAVGTRLRDFFNKNSGRGF